MMDLSTGGNACAGAQLAVAVAGDTLVPGDVMVDKAYTSSMITCTPTHRAQPMIASKFSEE